MAYRTADLCDAHGDIVQIAEPLFRHFGGRKAFAGSIQTVKAHEDNSLVRAALEDPGRGRVLVVDGGGSLRCAMLGDQLAQIAVKNGWAGVIVWGAVRDTDSLGSLDLGVMAIGAHPQKSIKRNEGRIGIPVHFAGVHWAPGAWAFADKDGIVVAEVEVGT